MTAPSAAASDSNHAQGAGFSVRDSNALKGIAILAIALHNFFHRVPNIVGENEFDFDQTRFSLFCEQLLTPSTAVQASFSFLGHYGVGIFVTLSTYGLALTSASAQGNHALGFLKSRLQKILPMIVVCISLWLLLQLRTHSLLETRYWSSILTEVFLLCIGLFNVLPGRAMPAVGPWWFIPFILQFYVLWAFGGKKMMALPTPVLLVLTAGTHGFMHWVNQATILNYQINLLETPVGHIPEITLGILLLRFNPSRLGAWLLPLAVLLAVGNKLSYLWPLTPIGATLILLIIYAKLRPLVAVPGFLATVGSWSLPIFMLNGYIRRPFLAISESSGIIGADLLLGAVSVGCSIALAALLTSLMDWAGAIYSGSRHPAR